MDKVLGCIVGILMLVLAILLLRFLPFIPLESKIDWITYLGLVLSLVTGGAAYVFFKHIRIALLSGIVTFAIIQTLLLTTPQTNGG